MPICIALSHPSHNHLRWGQSPSAAKTKYVDSHPSQKNVARMGRL